MNASWIVLYSQLDKDSVIHKFKKIATDIEFDKNVMTLIHTNGATTRINLFTVVELHSYVQVVEPEL